MLCKALWELDWVLLPLFNNICRLPLWARLRLRPRLHPRPPAGSAASILLEYRELPLSRLINAICRASRRASWVTATTLYNYRLFVWARDVVFAIWFLRFGCKQVKHT